MSLLKRFSILLFSTLLGMTTLAGCAGSDTKASTGDYVDDTVITARVKAALINDPMVKASQINVETFKGTVQLSGFVDTQANIDKAVRLTREIKGVQSVRNDMRLK